VIFRGPPRDGGSQTAGLIGCARRSGWLLRRSRRLAAIVGEQPPCTGEQSINVLHICVDSGHIPRINRAAQLRGYLEVLPGLEVVGGEVARNQPNHVWIAVEETGTYEHRQR